MRNSTMTGPLRPSTIRFAGKLALLSALLTVPMFLISVLLEGRYDTAARAIHLAVQGLGTLIFVTLTGSFYCFLNRNCGFNKANVIILGQIVLNLVYVVASSASIVSRQGEAQMRPFLMCLIFLLGVLQAALGMRLLALEHDLSGLKRQYCWLNIASGVFFASLLLIPVAIITSAVADVMLGTILILEARRLALPLESEGAGASPPSGV